MKKTTRIAAWVLCGAMALSCATPAFAAESTKKDENVFIVLNADGTVKEQTVSNWLHSDSGFQNFQDVSRLSDITNLKGSETPQQSGTNLVWNAEANDIYYQGKTEQTPPISAKIVYMLDGKEIAAKDLTGKSGHVKIEISLINNEHHSVTANGKKYDVVTPFATVVGASLPSDTFTNIKAEHGTVQTDASNQLVGFVCLPGVKESFDGLLTGKLSQFGNYLLDTVVIEADTKNCTVPTVMFACATDASKLTEEKGLSEFEDLQGNLDKLTDAVKQLQEGAEQLFGGAAKLDEGADTLKSGVNRLANGAVDLNSGAQKLQNGTEKLTSGAQKLTAGAQSVNGLLSQICQNNASLNAGAAQIFGAVLSSASTQLSAAIGQEISLNAQNFNDVLNGLLAGLGEDAIYAKVRAGVEAQIKTEENRTVAKQKITMITAGAIILKQQAAAAGSELSDTDAQQQAAAWAAREGGSAEIQAAINANTDLQALLASMQETIGAQAEAQLDALVAQTMESDAVKQKIAEANASASAGAQSITAVQQQLNQVNDFVNGVATYTASVARIQSEGAAKVYTGALELQTGASELSTGAAALYEGTKTLKSGTSDLQKGTQDLKNGTAALKDGSKKLADGTRQLKEESTDKLSGNSELSNLQTISTLTDTMKTAAKNYKSYTGAPGNISASVKFVMKTELPVRAEKKEAAAAPVAAKEKTTFFERIKNLFA